MRTHSRPSQQATGTCHCKNIIKKHQHQLPLKNHLCPFWLPVASSHPLPTDQNAPSKLRKAQMHSSIDGAQCASMKQGQTAGTDLVQDCCKAACCPHLNLEARPQHFVQEERVCHGGGQGQRRWELHRRHVCPGLIGRAGDAQHPELASSLCQENKSYHVKRGPQVMRLVCLSFILTS